METIIVQWEAIRNKEPHVTQCKNCLRFGHGTSNCHLKPRCSNTEKCEFEESQAKKCINYSGSHEGLDCSCLKRAQCIQTEAASMEDGQTESGGTGVLRGGFSSAEQEAAKKTLAPEGEDVLYSLAKMWKIFTEFCGYFKL